MNAKDKTKVQSIHLREEFLTPPSNANNLGIRYSTTRPLKLIKAHEKLSIKPRARNDQPSPKIQNNLASYKEEARKSDLLKYQEEIKGSIEKMLKFNKLPQLDLRKTRKGDYIISLEDLSFILATLVTKIDKKTELILELKRKVKSYKARIQDLNTVLKENTERLAITRKKEALGTERSPDFENTNGIRSFYTNQLTEKSNDILNDLQKVLKVKVQSELPQTLKKMTHVLKAIPEMESFIKEVTSIVHQEASSARNPDGVISTLKLWAKERDDCKKASILKNKVCHMLYGEKTTKDKQLVNDLSKVTRKVVK